MANTTLDYNDEVQRDSKSELVTKVQVFPFKEGPHLGHMKGLAVIQISNAFSIRGLRIMQRDDGEMFVGYPVDPFYKGEEYRHMVEPLSENVKAAVEHAVLAKWHEAMQG